MHNFSLPGFERSFLAILAGFATTALLTVVATTAVGRFFPSLMGKPEHPRLRYLMLNVAYSAAFAAAGGYVTAMIAKADPLRNTLVLAMVILFLSALSALQMRGKQPVLYQLALIAMTPVGALAGGLLRMHEAGYRW